MRNAALTNSYGGIGRSTYFVLEIGLIFATFTVGLYVGYSPGPIRLLTVLPLCAGFILKVLRLRNIGASQWLAMLMFIPFANFILDVAIQSAQTGWIETRRLDRTGVKIAVLFSVVTMFAIIALLTTYLSPFTR